MHHFSHSWVHRTQSLPNTHDPSTMMDIISITPTFWEFQAYQCILRLVDKYSWKRYCYYLTTEIRPLAWSRDKDSVGIKGICVMLPTWGLVKNFMVGNKGLSVYITTIWSKKEQNKLTMSTYLTVTTYRHFPCHIL